jgi:hypothetical protein
VDTKLTSPQSEIQRLLYERRDIELRLNAINRQIESLCGMPDMLTPYPKRPRLTESQFKAACGIGKGKEDCNHG